MVFKIPFSGRAHTYTEDEVQTVVKVMQSAIPLTQGIYQEQFEKKNVPIYRSKTGIRAQQCNSSVRDDSSALSI